MTGTSRRAFLQAATATIVAVTGCTDRSRSGDTTDVATTGTPERTRVGTTERTLTPTAEEPTPDRADHEAVRWWHDLGGRPSGGLAESDGLVVGGTDPWDLRAGTPTTPVEGSPVHAFESDDGTHRWSADLHAPARQPPLVRDGITYVSSYFSGGFTGVDEAIYAIDGTGGTVEWRFDPGADKFLRVLAVTDNTVFAGTADDSLGADGERTFAVEATTGEKRWEVESGDVFRGVTSGGSFVYSSAGGVRALDVESGEERWHHEPGAGTDRPVVLDGRVVTKSDSGAAGLAASDGSVEWQFSPDDGYVQGWTVVGGSVYARTSRGAVHAFDARTGEQRWATPVGEEGIAIEATNEGVYVPSGREVTALDPDDGSRRWRYGHELPLSRIRVGEPVIYVADRDRRILLAIEATDGTLRWEFPMNGKRVVLAVDGEQAFVGTSEGYLYALE